MNILVVDEGGDFDAVYKSIRSVLASGSASNVFQLPGGKAAARLSKSQKTRLEKNGCTVRRLLTGDDPQGSIREQLFEPYWAGSI